MIYAYTGRLGSGKTLSMIADAIREFRRSKRQIYTCMTEVKFPGQSYFDIEDLEALCDLRSGLILMDEAQIGLSARSWSKTPERVLSALAQSRKNGLDLYITTQALEKVDVQLRQLVNVQINCRCLGGRILINRAMDPISTGEPGSRRRVFYTKVRPIDRRWYAMYNTLEVLGSLRPSGHAVAEWLERVRDRGAKRPGPDACLAFLPSWARERSPGQFRVKYCDESAQIAEWLIKNGLASAKDPRLTDQVAHEGMRRRWLQMLGLDWRDVPSHVTLAHPWADGGSPNIEKPSQDLARAEKGGRRK